MSKFYITTAIAYTNAKPHIGFAMELVQGDVVARWRRQLGDSVIFTTGTDEHGSKIYKAATEAGKHPQEYVDEISTHFNELALTLNVKYDRFVRTSNPAHKEAARYLWQKLKDDLYKGTYKGWYCVGCEAYVSAEEAQTNKGECPLHNQPYEEIEEENYFFKLSKYTQEIKEAIETDRYRVIPKSRKHEILKVLEGGLEDISFSRSKEKLPWGIEVPDDPDQVMYVWPDALTNYISILGYPEDPDFSAYWPADVHIIGKDILRFHAAIWPAMLLSAGLELPHVLYVHGFITAGGKKMSKSLGNVIDPAEVVQEYGTDALRYYLLSQIPSAQDGDFTWERFETVYSSELADELGNLVQRVAAMIQKYQDGVVGRVPPHGHDMAAYEKAMQNLQFDKALSEVWAVIRGLNKFVDEEKPWEIAKSGDVEHLQEVLAYLVGSIQRVAELLQPFMPSTAKKIQDAYGTEKVKSSEILFPKHEVEPEK
ncbi:MAG: methionine--tRNA ligase [Candidatus Saccharimonadales bacterium]